MGVSCLTKSHWIVYNKNSKKKEEIIFQRFMFYFYKNFTYRTRFASFSDIVLNLIVVKYKDFVICCMKLSLQMRKEKKVTTKNKQ